MTVKVPHGFRDKDLARPVVEVRNFDNGQLAFEIYSFGNDTVVNELRTKENKQFKSYKQKPIRERIALDFEVTKTKIILRADLQYASQNIIIFADQQQIFIGSLSRSSEITLSLENKEGRRIRKEIDRNKNIYGRLK